MISMCIRGTGYEHVRKRVKDKSKKRGQKDRKEKGRKERKEVKIRKKREKMKIER